MLSVSRALGSIVDLFLEARRKRIEEATHAPMLLDMLPSQRAHVQEAMKQKVSVEELLEHAGEVPPTFIARGSKACGC